MTEKGVPIGEASRASGIKVPTIRYYEEIGLLPTPPRTEGNRRLYDPSDLQRLRFIRHARELGFEIAPIRELIALAGSPDNSCEGADMIAVAHLADIDHKIARLTALRTEIARMTECCNSCIGDRRVIEALGDHGQCMTQNHQRIQRSTMERPLTGDCAAKRTGRFPPGSAVGTAILEI